MVLALRVYTDLASCNLRLWLPRAFRASACPRQFMAHPKQPQARSTVQRDTIGQLDTTQRGEATAMVVSSEY